MAEVEIKYGGVTKGSMSASGSKTIKTGGKYCEGDITVQYSRPSIESPVIEEKTITQNGTYNAPAGVDGFNPVIVNVSGGSGGITPTGTINITKSGDTDVTEYATAHVDAGNVSSPSATKGTVSNNSVTVTPAVSYTAGYIESGSKTGTALTVSASELVSGTRSITSNSTGIDVTNYKYVDVNVSGGGGITPTGTINITSSGTTRVYEYEYANVAAGTAGTPTVTKGPVSNNSITVTPSVTNTSGFIQGGTVSGTGATVSASELVSGTKSITANGNGIDVTNYQLVNVNVSSGGGIPEPNPITAGDTPVWMDITTHIVNGNSGTYYSFTPKKAGTYKLTAILQTMGTQGLTGYIRKNGTNIATASFTTLSGVSAYCILQTSQSLTTSDTITLYISTGRTTSYIAAHGLIASIDWDNGF